MKILPLVTYPNPLLSQVSAPVEKVDDKLRHLMKDMVSTMYANAGIGLAAVQVGVLKRVLVMDINYETEDHHHHDHDHCHGIHVKNESPRFFVNPEIIEFSKEASPYNEGCLSFPGIRTEISRPAKVKVKFLDFDGQEKVEQMIGIMATCIQHEIDHLNGITLVDHVSKLKRDMIVKKLKKTKNA